MGLYERVEGKTVNGHGVWQMGSRYCRRGDGDGSWYCPQQIAAGKEEGFIYQGIDKKWWIGDRKAMEAGGASGWMRSASTSTALTPDQTTERWQMDGSSGWVDAPKVRSRAYIADEKDAAETRLAQERQQETANVKEATEKAKRAAEENTTKEQGRNILAAPSLVSDAPSSSAAEAATAAAPASTATTAGTTAARTEGEENARKSEGEQQEQGEEETEGQTGVQETRLVVTVPGIQQCRFGRNCSRVRYRRLGWW
jgi:hypothetical protein